jgi:hypothetical protein
MIKVIVGTREMHIKADGNQWCLGTMKQTKKGEVFDAECYYPTIGGLFNGLLEKKLKGKDYDSFTELIREVRKAKDELLGIYEGILETN